VTLRCELGSGRGTFVVVFFLLSFPCFFLLPSIFGEFLGLILTYSYLVVNISGAAMGWDYHKLLFS
jgi:hypothetical protein